MPELIGNDILYRKWEASPQSAAPRAVFLLVHGLGGHSARWGFLAEALAGRGWTVRKSASARLSAFDMKSGKALAGTTARFGGVLSVTSRSRLFPALARGAGRESRINVVK